MEIDKEFLSTFSSETQRLFLYEALKENGKSIKRLERLRDKLQYDAWYFKDVRKNAKKGEQKAKELLVVREKLIKEYEQSSEIMKMIGDIPK